MSGMLLQFYQTVKNDQLYIVVALLDDQIYVALGCSLEPDTKHYIQDINTVVQYLQTKQYRCYTGRNVKP